MSMTVQGIDASRVQWAVAGAAATEAEALAALATQPLLVLMHGFGSFEGDLIGLAPRLPHGFVCASPRAPLIAPPPIENGYSWWPLEIGPDGMSVRTAPPEEFAGSGPHVAATALLNWLDELNDRVATLSGGTGLGKIAVMGFSQGGCMVTSLLRMQPERFVCGVNCSGFVAPGKFDDSALAAVRPPLFWGRDDDDPIIGRDRIDQTAEWSPRHTELEEKLYDGIAHSISLEELVDIDGFLRRHVPESDTVAS